MIRMIANESILCKRGWFIWLQVFGCTILLHYNLLLITIIFLKTQIVKYYYILVKCF